MSVFIKYENADQIQRVAYLRHLYHSKKSCWRNRSILEVIKLA